MIQFLCSMVHEILVMTQHVSLHLVDLPQMFLCCKFENSFPFGYLETEQYAIGENLLMHTN